MSATWGPELQERHNGPRCHPLSGRAPGLPGARGLRGGGRVRGRDVGGRPWPAAAAVRSEAGGHSSVPAAASVAVDETDRLCVTVGRRSGPGLY